MRQPNDHRRHSQSLALLALAVSRDRGRSWGAVVFSRVIASRSMIRQDRRRSQRVRRPKAASSRSRTATSTSSPKTRPTPNRPSPPTAGRSPSSAAATSTRSAPDGSGQRQLTSGAELDSAPLVSPERQASSSSSGARAEGAAADLYTVRALGGGAARADQRLGRRRPRGRLLARRPGDRLRPRSDGAAGRQPGRPLLGPSERRRPRPADRGPAASTSSSRATSPAASSSAAARAATARPPTPTSTRCAATARRVKSLVAGVGSAYVEDVSPDGHTLLFRRDQGLWVKRIGPGRARKLARAPRRLARPTASSPRTAARSPPSSRPKSSSRWSRSTSPAGARPSSRKASRPPKKTAPRSVR